MFKPNFFVNTFFQVSVVFINLKNVNIESPECFSLLQTAFYSIEELLHWNEGSLRQFIVDDKGAVAIGVFGYPHSSHDNDAVRAVNFALAIKNKFRTLCIDYSIGITSGNAFCGTIGSHNRHEYTIIGDIGFSKLFLFFTLLLNEYTNIFFSQFECSFNVRCELSSREIIC